MSEKTDDKKKQTQQKYLELQLLDHQMSQAQKQIQMLENQVAELDIVQQSLDSFATMKPGSESFVTLTPGIFAKSELKDVKHVVVNIGAGVAVQKTIPETKMILATQSAEMRKLQEELTAQLEKLAEKAEQVEAELKKIIE